MQPSKDERREVTERLSKIVFKKLRREYTLVAREVWVDEDHRVDFVGYKPRPMESYPAALERGTFVFVEVKSCLEDLKSGHGLTFHGDENWLVCPASMMEDEKARRGVPYGCKVYCPDSANRLHMKLDNSSDSSWRQKSALELLWRMVDRSGGSWRTKFRTAEDGDPQWLR